MKPAAVKSATVEPVEMVSVGDELLSGRTLDTNGAALGRWLAGHGLSVRRRVTVPDDRALIRGALADALARAPLVVVCGGLGPTSDDVTREAAADLLGGAGCVVDPAAAEALRAQRAAQGRPFDEGARRMVSHPAGARPIPNPAGVALAFAIEVGGPDGALRTAVFLPGVPREFAALLEPALGPLVAGPSAVPRAALPCSTFGLPESEIDARLRPLETEEIRFQYGVHHPIVRVTLVAEGDAARADAFAEHAARFRAALGDVIYGDGHVGLAEVVLGHLRRLGWRLSTAESCTGGLIAQWLTAVPGMSAAFELGFVTYANEAKRAWLGVPAEVLDRHGAVSREAVEHMARGARERARAELAVAVSGIAGPDGGTPAKPVGTVHLSLAAPDGVSWLERRFSGDRGAVRRLAAATALDMVRRYCEAR